MRRHPNPPGCAVAGALARHYARRAASTPASRRDARLLPRAGTDLSARRHRRGRARGRTRRPAPRIPHADPGPVATSDGRRRSRRPRGGPRVDGRTEPPSASAAPNATLATRVRDATSATLAARVAKPRTAADPRAQGHPTRSSRTDPRRAGGSSHCAQRKRLPFSYLSTDSSRVVLRFTMRVAVRPRVTRAWFVAFLTIVSVGTALGTCSNTCESMFQSNQCSCTEGKYKKSVGGCSCTWGVCSKTEYSCHSCHASCRGCDGGGSDDCTTCDDGKYESSGQCHSCHSDCATCKVGGSDGCLTCASSATPHVKYKPGNYYGHFDYGTCVECTENSHCGSGEYCDGSTCQSCHSNCATCRAGGSGSCESCHDGRYADFNFYGECKLCHSTCATCTRQYNTLFGMGSTCTRCIDTSKLASGDMCVECLGSSDCTAKYGQGYICRGLGTAASCDPSPCDASALPANAVDLGDCTSSLESGSSCEPTCASGYTRSGVTSCLAGTLTSEATCESDPCDTSTLPANAVDLGDCHASLASGSSCEPTCASGYTRSGVTSCLAGTLTSEATCDPDPCVVVAPDNGGIGSGGTNACGSSLASGSSCEPTCASGYTRSGVTSCFTGTLTSATCDPDPCDASALPANAVSLGDCTATLASGSSCSPQCTIGFYPVAATCVAGTLTQAAACSSEPSCDASALPTNGANEGTCSSALASGSTCAPACLNGYSVNGTTTCAAGTLTSVATCDPDPCNFVAPDNAADAGSCTATLLSGNTCSPTCASGYTRNGVTSCLAGTLTSATCDPDPCDASALPANAESLGDCTATLASGSSCEPTCDLGYVASVATCFAGNLTAAACDREASCDASALPSGAADLGDCNATLPSRSSCSPTCDDGYTLAASSECVSGTLTPATCEETPKPPPPPSTPPPSPRNTSLVFEDDDSRAKRAGAQPACAIAFATVAAVLAA